MGRVLPCESANPAEDQHSFWSQTEPRLENRPCQVQSGAPDKPAADFNPHRRPRKLTKQWVWHPPPSAPLSRWPGARVTIATEAAERRPEFPGSTQWPVLSQVGFYRLLWIYASYTWGQTLLHLLIANLFMVNFMVTQIFKYIIEDVHYYRNQPCGFDLCDFHAVC